MTDLFGHLEDEVLLCDGAMGSRVQAADLNVEIDFWGKENCTEVLNLSRPDIVREIHRGYAAAGADLVLTNSCLLYTSPSPRDQRGSRMPSSA